MGDIMSFNGPFWLLVGIVLGLGAGLFVAMNRERFRSGKPMLSMKARSLTYDRLGRILEEVPIVTASLDVERTDEQNVTVSRAWDRATAPLRLYALDFQELPLCRAYLDVTAAIRNREDVTSATAIDAATNMVVAISVFDYVARKIIGEVVVPKRRVFGVGALRSAAPATEKTA